jgi:hypothetical protein
MKSIALDKIPQKRIREFIQVQLDNNIHSPSEVKSTYSKGDDLSSHLMHEEIYTIPFPLDIVWTHYVKANPNEVWNGKMLSFGLMVSKHEDEVMYVGEDYTEAKVGQVFYINLNIFGLVTVAVSHEIIAVESDKKYFELSYVEGGKSVGKQRISFFETGEGETHIVHTTYYKSDSNFRDRYIYPFFHTRAIGEYHGNMVNSLRANL